MWNMDTGKILWKNDSSILKPRLHQRNMLRATCCFKQHVASNKHHVARNMLPRNMLRWCKRGLKESYKTIMRIMWFDKITKEKKYKYAAKKNLL